MATNLFVTSRGTRTLGEIIIKVHHATTQVHLLISGQGIDDFKITGLICLLKKCCHVKTSPISNSSRPVDVRVGKK